MSTAKDSLARGEYYHKIAFEEMVAAGLIVPCDIHSDSWWYVSTPVSSDIYKITVARIKEKYGTDLDYKLLDEQIEDIINCAGLREDGCPLCEKLFRD